MSFFSELKRRNVFRVTAAYLALSWVITQVTGAVVPALHLPDSIPSIVVWLAVIGFPFIVLFSWVYEFTPEGLKRESEVDRAASITHITSKRLDYIIIGLLVLAIGLFAFDRLMPVGAGLPRDHHAQEAASDSRAQGALLREAIAAGDKSIAVLPFADMSADKDQEYMSDGIAEELLNLLSQVPDLKVIARTSSFAFKGKDVPIAEIAQTLNVAHVLEGSVRKSGNKVRITAQLIRTADSTHLWSETYDRPLDDIFAVQDEIADAIVQALQVRLAGGELSRSKGGTQNLEAYQLYLRAWNADWYTVSSLDAAGEYLEQAIKLDEEYGMAWSAQASVVGSKTDNGWLDPAEGYERVRQLAQHALQLSPDLTHAHTRLQYVYFIFDWNWAASEAEGRRALAIDPTYPWALLYAGMLARTLGRWDESTRQLRAALDRDPLNTYVMWNLGNTYYRSGRFADAEATFRELLRLSPDFPWTRWNLGLTLLAQGQPDAALEVVQLDPNVGERLWVLPIVLQAAGRQEEADEALKAQIELWAKTGAFAIARTYAYRGDPGRTLEWLERAYKQKDSGLLEVTGEPLFKSTADDPRFKAFLHKMNLPTEPVPVNWQ